MAVLRAVRGSNRTRWTRRHTYGSPGTQSSGTVEIDSTQQATGTLQIEEVPAGVARVGDVVVIFAMRYRVDGVEPAFPFGKRVSLSCDEVRDGVFDVVLPWAIAGRVLAIGGSRLAA